MNSLTLILKFYGGLVLLFTFCYFVGDLLKLDQHFYSKKITQDGKTFFTRRKD